MSAPALDRLSGRRLWALTAAICAAIVVGGTPRLRSGIVRAATHPDLLLWGGVVLFGLAAAGSTVIVAGRLLARGDDRAARVLRLSARGGSVAEIARATDLAQDAVRDLLATAEEAAAESVGRPGNFFRRSGGRNARRDRRAAAAPTASASRG